MSELTRAAGNAPAPGDPEVTADESTRVIPVIEEQLTAERQRVRTGSVRVQKHVEHRTKRVQSTVLHDGVEVKRVAVNRVVTEAPKIRHENGIIIVPVLEEQVVMTRRLVLKEEIHVVRKRTKERVSQDVSLGRERAVIERLDAEGRVIATTEE